jgi:cephalosporin-C deacetylase
MRSNDQVETFEIHYTSLDGLRIAGWYCHPRESAQAPPYPALLIVPGYISEPTLPKQWAKAGYAAVGVTPRGKLRSNSHFNPGYPGLLVDNIIDKETYAYHGFYIDAARAVDFVLSRPEIDHSRIGVQGGSQGGALTLTTAALRNDVITCGAAGAPYLTGYMDAISFTHSYPYEEMNEYRRLYPEREAQMRATLDYYDCLNFAPNIRCPMLISIGLGDDVCPPETAFDLLQALTCPVESNAYPRCAHDAGGFWEGKNIADFLAKHLQPTPVPAR